MGCFLVYVISMILLIGFDIRLISSLALSEIYLVYFGLIKAFHPI